MWARDAWKAFEDSGILCWGHRTHKSYFGANLHIKSVFCLSESPFLYLPYGTLSGPEGVAGSVQVPLSTSVVTDDERRQLLLIKYLHSLFCLLNSN